MIDIIKILFFFISGIFYGYFINCSLISSNFSQYILYVLLFLIGITIGGNKKFLSFFKKIKINIFLIPLSIIVGSSIGAIFYSIFFKDLDIKESLAICYGFGYYSLSSIIISNIKGDDLGVIALLTNILREIITIIFTPLFVKLFGEISPIASAGATSMDTTLPIIKKYTDEKWAIISFINGILLSILVPVLVSFVLSI